MNDRGSRNRRLELRKTVIHQHQILGQHWGAGRSPSKIAEEGKTVDTYGEEKERRRKYKMIFPTVGGESTNPEIWKLYINTYIHGVQKNTTIYIYHPGMELISTVTLLNHIIISQLRGCVSKDGKPDKFPCRTDSDTQCHHSGKQ